MFLKRIKRHFSVFIAALFMFSAVSGLAAFLFKPGAVSFAADSEFKETELVIPNGHFNNTSSSSFPKTPSEWTGAALNGSSSASKLYHGVISLDHTVYNSNKVRDDYHLRETDRVPSKGDFIDNDVLMINTKDATAAYAYTSASVALEANKCYEISAWILTFDFKESGASIKLVDAETNLSIGTKADLEKKTPENLLAFRNINTSVYDNVENKWNYHWRQYSFNVQTYSTSMNIKVSLGIGDAAEENGVNTRGIAFFDNVRGRTISREAFEKATATPTFLKYSFSDVGKERGRITGPLNLGDPVNTSYIANGSFTEGADKMDGWKWINADSEWNWGKADAKAPNHVGNKPSVADLSEDKVVSPFFIGGDRKTDALRIQNMNSSASGVISAPFALQRYRFYRLSVWYRTLDGAQANIYLTTPNTDSARLISENARKTLSSITSLSSGENGDSENWQQSVFYIKGSSVEDIENVSLELWLGYGDFDSTGTHSKGIAFFDMIEIQYVDSDEYSKHSESGTAVTLDAFASSSTITNGILSDVEYTVDGGFEDYFDIDYINSDSFTTRPKKPLSPASWSYVTGENKDLNPLGRDFDYNDSMVSRGVIPGNEAYLGGADAPVLGRFENVLMVRNNGKSAAGYSSPEISVSPSSYQKISVWVSTRDGAKAFLQLTENGKPVAAIENISTQSGQAWQLYSFIIWTDADTSSLTLTLWNGWCCEEQGAAKKNLSFGAAYFANANSDTADADEYGRAASDKTSKTVMAVDMVSHFGLFGNSGVLKTPFRYNAESAGGTVSSGVLDTQFFTNAERDQLGIDNPGTSKDGLRYVLAINNRTKTAFKYTSVKSQTLNASSHYRVTVSVMTSDISGRGAQIALAGIDDAVFTGIATEGKYRAYTFLIATGSDSLTFNYELGLGDVSRQSSYTKGFAFFDDMNVESISKSEYANTNIENSVKLSFITTTEKEPGKTDKEKGFWDWMWLPTVLLGIALLFVLVMLSIRKLAPAVGRFIQSHRKAKAASYDRSEVKPGKQGKARKQPSDDEYEDVVESRTVKSEPAAEADAETAATESADAAKGKKAEAPDAYTDYFED